MRLITHKLWRAFPELDRFDDRQCAQFVRVAASGAVARALRWVCMAAACVFGCVLIPLLGLVEAICIRQGWLQNRSLTAWLDRPRWMSDVVYVLIALVVMFSLGALFGGLARDFLLRRRVRKILRTRGRCARCTYFLGGLPVSDDLKVVCPECGFVTEVDRSLGELRRGDGGAGRFDPSEAVIRASEPWLTPELLRRWGKRCAAAAAAVLVVAGVGWGWHEWTIYRQAVRARALKPGMAALIELAGKAQPKGAANDGADAFTLLGSVVKKMAKAQADLFPDGMPSVDGVTVYAEGEWVAQRPNPNESESTIKERVINEPVSVKLLEEFERRGVFVDMKEMVDAPLAVGLQPQPREVSLLNLNLADYATVRRLARWNAARMRLAVREDDPARFADACGTTLGIAQMMEKQPVLIGRLVAIAVEALAYGEMRAALRERHDSEWVDAYESVLKNHQRHEARALPFEGERLFAKDLICWVFAEPSRVRLGRYSPALRTALGGIVGGMGGTGPVPDGRLGTLEENISAFDDYYSALIAEAALPRTQRKPVASTGSDLVLAKLLQPAMQLSFRSFDQAEIDRVATPLLVALERYRLERGGYPAKLSELAPTWLPEVPLDPWSGKPFGYKRLDAAQDVQKRGFLLYAVGSDGVDNGGMSGQSPWDAILQYSPAGIDYIINDEKR